MKAFTNGLIGFIAIEHIGFLILEMFLYTKPIGQKIFKITPEYAEQSKMLAANMGLYNGFLAAGLIWALFFSKELISHSLKVFFLSCILIAGLYGWYSVSKTILIVQAIPALVALLLVFTYKKSLRT